MHIRHYHPQDHIIRRSEQSSAMFYVLRGTVKVASHDNEATYYEIKENNFFGDVGVLYKVPRSMDVLAKNRCTIAILSGDDLVKTMEQSPEMAKAIGYQSQERYQMYLKRRQSISARRTLDGGTGTPDQCQDDSRSDSFAKSDVHGAIHKVEPRTYNLGECIIRRGEIGREMFFIISGVVEILSDDNLLVLARFREGQFFGEIAVLLDVPRIANVKAVSEVEVFVLTKDNLEAVFQAVPGAAETITAEGNRLYKNWLLQNSIQNPDERMADEAVSLTDAEMNLVSLNAPRKLSVSAYESMPLQESGVGATSPLCTDQPGSSAGLPLGSIHPFEAGHPADSDLGPFDTTSAVTQESQSAPINLSFDQDAFSPFVSENTPEPPMSRNPTIRGLQESTPKRRRASVAVWSQQDLLKLAEAAEAKTSIEKTHIPVKSSTIATFFSSIPAADLNQTADTHEKPSLEKRASSASLTKKPPLTRPATFQDLDECIVVQILNVLPLDCLLRARGVCKGWNKLILEHNDILRVLDLVKYKKIVSDTLLMGLCTTILSRNPMRTTHVSLRDCFLVTDKGLSMLAAHMPAVQELDLHSCWNVTDAGFRSLGQHCSRLRSIDFSNCRKLGDETIFGLYPKEAVRIVDPLPKKQLHGPLSGPHRYASPELEDTVEQDHASPDTSMDEAQAILTRRPSIEMEPSEGGTVEAEPRSPLAMDVESPRMPIVGLTLPSIASPEPKGCPLLARLNLSYCKNLTDRSFIHLSLYGSKQLEYLNLQRCTTITSEAFIALDLDSKQTVHEDYVIDSNGQGISVHEGYSPLLEPCFPRLRELHLSDCTYLTDDAIVALAPNMPRLEVLSLSFCCALTDIAVEALCESCLFLKKLDLSFCGSAVSDASLYQLARFDALEPGRHSLEDLEIRGCVRVTERGVREVLKGCANLKRLNISNCSGIGSGDLATAVCQAGQLDRGEDVPMQEARPLDGDSSGSWAALPNASHNGEVTRKMNALKRGKEWALAQQRPGLRIIV
ncbi:hypothetical protein BGZ58_003570 [Dissophora ornata]|nr:hypothetical protein BGZ58_003570 [Dissophora ornata]